MNSETKTALLRLRWHIRHPEAAMVVRAIYKMFRPHSFPYISGDGFRHLADHVYDETRRRLSPKLVRTGSIIFISTDRAEEFLKNVDGDISVPHVLITHNSDLPVDRKLASLCGPGVVRWFAQNNTDAHEKVVPIPIGIENLHHYRAGIPKRFNARRKEGRAPTLNRILVGFSVGTNMLERQPAYEVAARATCAVVMPARSTQDRYLQLLGEYRFVLAPPGNGLDTHRAWEAMYLGVVPIVKDSVAMRAFEALGLPLWIVGSWEQLLQVRESDLASKYESLKGRFSCPALFMDYWRLQIEESVRECNLIRA
ncbi:MAG TPA: hypothetical protein VFH29_03610 [Anaerolineales bacterium]|nr:hypothetical protein [Anaerolineales bacterium]